MMQFPDFLIDVVNEQMVEHKVPGASVGLLTADGIAIQGFGVTNVEHPSEVSAETIFQVGSITKTMTATLLMMLSEDGKLDLDAPVQSILPDFRVADAAASAAATVRQLLTHSTGWDGDLFHDTGPGADAKALYVKEMADIPQITPPGYAFSYNNAAFCTAGRIIEVITGKLFEVAMRKMLFEPLGMNNSFFDAADVMLRSFAVGHNRPPMKSADDESERPPVVASPWPIGRYAAAAGGVASTAGDMLTYAQFYLNKGRTADGVQLISAEAMAQLWTPQFPVGSGMGDSVAHSWFVKDEGGSPSYAHGGGTNGQMSLFKVIPDKQFAFIALTNGNTGYEINTAVERTLLDKLFDVRHARPDIVTSSSEELDELVGHYERPMAYTDITREGNQLSVQMVQTLGFPNRDTPPPPPGPPILCKLTAEGHLRGASAPFEDFLIDVVRAPSGQVGWIRIGGRLHPKV